MVASNIQAYNDTKVSGEATSYIFTLGGLQNKTAAVVFKKKMFSLEAKTPKYEAKFGKYFNNMVIFLLRHQGWASLCRISKRL